MYELNRTLFECELINVHLMIVKHTMVELPGKDPSVKSEVESYINANYISVKTKIICVIQHTMNVGEQKR